MMQKQKELLFLYKKSFLLNELFNFDYLIKINKLNSFNMK